MHTRAAALAPAGVQDQGATLGRPPPATSRRRRRDRARAGATPTKPPRAGRGPGGTSVPPDRLGDTMCVTPGDLGAVVPDVNATTLDAAIVRAAPGSFAEVAEGELDAVYRYLVFLTGDRALAEDLA